ncbi:mitochondrial fission regulator 1 [Senna tora]|uniref:Mitochondrial fission regulator 1 n=1 Tax=Senna tora TaxID=362788 RepID=A0A834WQ29_9FABA|nr:mitochondrial fission regulator 1 [Senna tora]
MGPHDQEPSEAIIPAEQQHQDHSLEPTNNLLSMLRLNSTTNPSSSSAAGGCDHLLHHPPCTACGCHGSNSMKRRSPESDFESTRAKKPSFEQEDLTRRHGFTAIPLPLSLETLATIHNAKSAVPVLRRCISDPYSPPSSAVYGAPATADQAPSSTLGSPTGSASRLPPRPPPSLKRCVSDISTVPNSPDKTISLTPSVGDMRLRRMKDRLREMRHWWDEVMQEDGEEEVEEDAYEGHKAISNNSKDECVMGGGAEEVVSVEWVEKCLSIHFKCPCGKGYQILLSGNKCYYKLV